MTDTSAGVTWLTQEAYDLLKAELDHLSGPGRVEISKKIEAAREEGDLRENGGYHAAKEEQGKQEARIRQLEQMLANARVGDSADLADDGTVRPGMVVTAEIAGAEETFLLGSREIAATTELDVFSEKSPLGEAILGRSVGDATSYTAPNGREIPVVVHDAKPFTG